MSVPAQSKATFSTSRKWGIGFNVGLVSLVVLAVVVMLNFLGREHFFRIHLSSFGRISLAPRTVHFLQSLTNRVNVVIYYDKDDSMYSMVTELLNEYQLANGNIHVRTVDYLRDPGEALQLKQNPKYSFLAAPNAKNFIIFDCAGRVKAVEGNSLAKYVLEEVPNPKEREFRRRPVAFEGERMFTGALMAVTNPKPFKAYFLTGDGEHSITSEDELLGYRKLAIALQQDYIKPEELSLGTNAIPEDCNLLVIAGPTDPLPELTLHQIEHYLERGGRLFTLFDVRSAEKATGLETLLAKWGVNVTTNVIKDPDNTTQSDLMDMKVGIFGRHPIVNPLQDLQIHLIYPRAIGKFREDGPAADAPTVDVLAFSGARSFADHHPELGRQSFPLMVAVEKGAIKGVVTERGTTRIVVTGDSIFLGNHYIDSAANRDFARYAVNWLLDRPELLEGLPPRPINEYRLSMTHSQQQNAEWLLLGGMPASVLVLGSLVWLRRRR